MMQNLPGWLKDPLEKAANMGGSGIDKTYGTISSTLDKTSETGAKALDWMQQMFHGYNHKVNEIVGKGTSKLDEGVAAAYDKLADGIGAGGKMIGDLMGKLKPPFKLQFK